MYKYINLYTWKSQNRIKKLLTDDPLDHNKHTFLFKLIYNELSILDRLAIRQPKVYSSFTIYLLCHLTEENIEHLFLFIKNDLHTTIISIANNITLDTSSLIKFTSSFIQSNYITTIKQVIGSFNKSRNILNIWSNYFRKSFFKNIWQLRCKVLIEAEKQHGITNRMKRKRAHIIQIENNETNDDSNSNYNNSNNNHDNNNSGDHDLSG
ncbi:hypothetical protein Glove_100g10 [Diversispora epigaea]|uniref:Uncharacterized protein n=1 Tax=Diversispora epigaea TaxID=1348612 RepID=A0A397J6C4_9GLOM|nr:hypothetical protein Glove_100g10 [Diversispora epigaea]